MKNRIVSDLFDTEALRVSPAEDPFWYTSGLFGPYYVNTHFLYGSAADAEALLSEIELWAKDTQRQEFTKKIAALTKKQYDRNPIYRRTVEALLEAARLIDCDFVSGGERRDFFFSLEAARQLGKPHLSIFKDQTAYYSEDLYSEAHLVGKGELSGLKALHVADLITEASSYFRAWIPAVEACGAQITASLAVVDRCQGGVGLLEQAGIDARCLVRISKALFAEAREQGLINKAQEEILLDYARDPHGFVSRFLEKRPEFLDKAAATSPKTAERVNRLREMLAREV